MELLDHICPDTTSCLAKCFPSRKISDMNKRIIVTRVNVVDANAHFIFWMVQHKQLPSSSSGPAEPLLVALEQPRQKGTITTLFMTKNDRFRLNLNTQNAIDKYELTTNKKKF